jgi:hypothetical protein
MGGRTSDSPMDTGIIYHGTGGFDWKKPFTLNDFGFYDEKGIVEGIDVSATASKDVNFFRTLWKTYSPERVLMDYGPPTRVQVGIFKYGEASFSSFRIIVIYDTLGFLAIYEGKTLELDTPEGHMLRICPNWSDIAWTPKLDMFILSPSNSMSLDEFVSGISSFEIDGKSIEEAAGITPEELQQRFLPGNGPPCFNTSQDLWD